MFKIMTMLLAFGVLLLVQTENSRAQPTASFTVKKIVINSTGGSLAGYSYPINISCTGPTTVSANPSLAASGHHTLGGVTYTSVCTVSEDLSNFHTPVQHDCPSGNVPTWLPPIYNPAPALTIGPVFFPSSNTVTVTNQLKCVKTPPKTGSLLIRKSIDNPYHANLNGISFSMSVKCGGTTYPTFPLSAASPQHTLTLIPGGVTCKVTELTQNMPLPPPVASCAKPKKLIWLAPIYTPASTIISAGNTVNLSVSNRLACQLPNVIGPKTHLNKGDPVPRVEPEDRRRPKDERPRVNDDKKPVSSKDQDGRKPVPR